MIRVLMVLIECTERYNPGAGQTYALKDVSNAIDMELIDSVNGNFIPTYSGNNLLTFFRSKIHPVYREPNDKDLLVASKLLCNIYLNVTQDNYKSNATNDLVDAGFIETKHINSDDCLCNWNLTIGGTYYIRSIIDMMENIKYNCVGNQLRE